MLTNYLLSFLTACKVKWGYCKHSFQYGEKALDDCPGYKLNKARRCPIQNYQCTNAGPLGPNQYGGHGWCYYDYEGKTYWDWCGSGCKYTMFFYVFLTNHELKMAIRIIILFMSFYLAFQVTNAHGDVTIVSPLHG